MKTTRLTKNLNFILVLLFFVFFSCTDEEKNINTENEVFEVGNFFMSELTTEELSSNVVAIFKESNFTGKSAALKDAEEYEIDWENGNYMQVGGQHSYTFPIIPSKTDVGIQNIVYQSMPSGGYAEYLYTYELSLEEMVLLVDGQPIPLEEKVKKQFLQKLEKIPSANKGGGDCGYKGWIGTDQYGVTRIYSHKDDCENKIGLGQCRWEDKTYPCQEVLDSGNEEGSGGGSSSGDDTIGHVTILQRGPNSGDGQSTGIYDNGSNTSGGGGSGGTFTAPLALTKPYYLARDLGFDNNSFEAKFLNANKEVTDKIYKYILEENKSEEALDFAKEAVKAIIDDGEVDFDEKIIIHIDNECNKEIIREVIDGKNPIIDLVNITFVGNDESFPNLSISSDDLSDSTQEGTVLAVTRSIYDNEGILQKINIIMNDKVMSNGTDIAKYSILLHELVHALLSAHLYYGNITSDNENGNLSALAESWAEAEAIRRHGTGLTSSEAAFFEHEIIADLAKTIEVATKNYGVSKGYVIDDFVYESLSWAGLSDTIAFTLFEDFVQEAISETIANEASNFLNLGEGNPCN